MNTNEPKASPNRLLMAFLRQKAKLLAALNDEGGLFECRFLARLVERCTSGIEAAHTEAVELNTGLTELRQQLLLDLAPTDDTPGQLDPTEQQSLLQRLASLGLTARQTVSALKQLR
jgi:hypothetical protein